MIVLAIILGMAAGWYLRDLHHHDAYVDRLRRERDSREAWYSIPQERR